MTDILAEYEAWLEEQPFTADRSIAAFRRQRTERRMADALELIEIDLGNVIAAANSSEGVTADAMMTIITISHTRATEALKEDA